MAFLLPFLLAASLVDSKPLASILPLLRHIDSMNPQGPHFTIEAIKKYGGLYNSASYQLWPQDSSSSSSSSPAFLPSSFSSFPPSPSAQSSFPSPFNASPSFPSSSSPSSYLASSPQTSFDSTTSSTGAVVNFAPQLHHPRIGNTNDADSDQKLISASLSEPKLKISKSKSDQKLKKSESVEKQLRNLENDPKGSSKKKLSLYDALRSRADMVKSENTVSKSAALLKSVDGQSSEQFPTDKTEEMKLGQFEGGLQVGNSLENFPVSFHPEEELARKG